MVAQTLKPEVAAVASMLVRLAHPSDHSLHRALEKAQERLIALPWSVDCGILQIASHSHPSECHATDGEICDCPTTRGCCWHRAAWHILSAVAATGVMPVAPLPLPPGYRHIEAEDFPGDFLDAIDDLDYDEYGDIVARPRVAAPFPEPYRPRASRVHVPAPGSDFARAEERADRMFAA